jgi:hypothetical protein
MPALGPRTRRRSRQGAAAIVTGDVNLAAVDDLVRLCVQLDKLRHHPSIGDDSADDR